MVLVDHRVHRDHVSGSDVLAFEGLLLQLREDRVGRRGSVRLPVAGEAPAGEGVVGPGEEEARSASREVALRDGDVDPTAAQRRVGVGTVPSEPSGGMRISGTWVTWL